MLKQFYFTQFSLAEVYDLFVENIFISSYFSQTFYNSNNSV